MIQVPPRFACLPSGFTYSQFTHFKADSQPEKMNLSLSKVKQNLCDSFLYNLLYLWETGTDTDV